MAIGSYLAGFKVELSDDTREAVHEVAAVGRDLVSAITGATAALNRWRNNSVDEVNMEGMQPNSAFREAMVKATQGQSGYPGLLKTGTDGNDIKVIMTPDLFRDFSVWLQNKD